MSKYVQYADKHLADVDSLTELLGCLRSKMRKSKFESMIKRFLQDDSVALGEVSESDANITIDLSSKSLKNIQELEKVLSRAEEKSVRIVETSLCHS